MRLAERSEKIDRRISLLYALWLNGITWVFVSSDAQAGTTLEITLLLGAFPAFLQVLSRRVNYQNFIKPARYILMFAMILSLSYVSNIGSLQPYAIVYLLNILYVMVIAMFIGCNKSPSILNKIAANYAIFGSIFLLKIIFQNTLVLGERLRLENVGPNYIGLVGVSVGICAIALSNRVLISACWMVVSLTLFFASSRTSMLAFLCALMVFLAILLFWQGYKYKFKILFTFIVLIVTVLSLPQLLSPLVDVFMDKVFQVNDAHRGLDTGFTGRMDVWIESIHIWKEFPVFGVGYRHHEYYVSSLSSSHNAYLAMLLDTGIIGLSAYLFFLLSSIYKGFTQINDPTTAKVTLGIILGYAIYGMFESRALNAGNAFSILFLIACFCALTSKTQRKSP